MRVGFAAPVLSAQTIRSGRDASRYGWIRSIRPPVDPVRRVTIRYRTYNEANVQMLRFIHRARNLGFSRASRDVSRLCHIEFFQHGLMSRLLFPESDRMGSRM